MKYLMLSLCAVGYWLGALTKKLTNTSSWLFGVVAVAAVLEFGM